jgi:hypothetical protein
MDKILAKHDDALAHGFVVYINSTGDHKTQVGKETHYTPYVDIDCTTPMTAAELEKAFITGMLICYADGSNKGCIRRPLFYNPPARSSVEGCYEVGFAREFEKDSTSEPDTRSGSPVMVGRLVIPSSDTL